MPNGEQAHTAAAVRGTQSHVSSSSPHGNFSVYTAVGVQHYCKALAIHRHHLTAWYSLLQTCSANRLPTPSSSERHDLRLKVNRVEECGLIEQCASPAHFRKTRRVRRTISLASPSGEETAMELTVNLCELPVEQSCFRPSGILFVMG